MMLEILEIMILKNFVTYCYDYNDTTSSSTLISPYKIKLTFKDLD